VTNEQIDQLIERANYRADWNNHKQADLTYLQACMQLLAEIAKRMPESLTSDDIEWAVWRAMNPR